MTAYDSHNVKDNLKVLTYMKTLVCFMTFSVYRSVYWKLYRLWLVKSEQIGTFGHHARRITTAKINDRTTAITNIRQTIHFALDTKPLDRTDHDIKLLVGILEYMGNFSDFGFCEGWSMEQLKQLATKVRLRHVPFLSPIYEAGSKDGMVYFLMQGCARTFLPEPSDGAKASIGQAYNGLVRGFSEDTQTRTYRYKNDIQPSSFIGEQVLGGMSTKLLSVLSISECDLMVIDAAEYASISASEGKISSGNLNEKYGYLRQSSLFQHYDDYRLSRLAEKAYMREVKKGERVVEKGTESPLFCLIIQGELGILSDLNETSTLTVLTEHDHYGESSVLRFHNPKEPSMKKREFMSNINKKNENNTPRNHYLECFHQVARSVMMVLIIPGGSFSMIDAKAVELLRSTYVSRAKWRQNRADLLQVEQEENHIDKLSLNSLQLVPKLGNLSSLGVNSLSPIKLSSISENERGNSSKLLEIPHLDASLDPLLMLANCKTINDVNRKEAYIANVNKFEKARARNLLSHSSLSSPSSNSSKESLSISRSFPAMRRMISANLPSLSGLKLSGTMGSRVYHTSNGTQYRQRYEDHYEAFDRARDHSSSDDISVGGDLSIGETSTNSIDSGVRSFHSSFN